MTSSHNPQLTDDDLLRLVGEAIDESEPMPLGAVEFASQAFTWRDVNSELAELLHDSLLDLVDVRDSAPARMLIFQAGEVTLDLEHDAGALRGVVSPPARYRVEVQRAVDAGGDPAPQPSGAETVTTDEFGMFEIDRSLAGLVRIAVHTTAGGAVLVTPWTTV